MKKILYFLMLGVGFVVNAQSIDYNTKKGYVAEGYDVVTYFKNDVKKGDPKYILKHDGVKYKFSSQENLDLFEADPDKYIPQYGGYCAYAIAVNSKKVSVDPETYEIRESKLYLFYNAWGTNTLKSWKESDPDKLKHKADQNWEQIKDK